MKLFKSIDEKFAEIGFTKVQDDEYAVRYEREYVDYKFTQVLTILHKHSGRHIIHSYDKHLHDRDYTGNVSIGLTYYETKLIMKKMRQKGWKSR